jgi:protein-disulfide isomerase
MWLSRALSVLAVASLGLFAAASQADSDKGFSEAQKQQLEKLMEQYILDHPEVLLEAVRRHQEKRETAEKEQAQTAVAAHMQQLVSDPTSPVAGNPKGDVTIVEFFDYRCGYCKRVHPTIEKILTEDTNIRLVLKEFPILGPQSLSAARAALAAWKIAPEKYMAFHNDLMTSRGEFTEAKIAATAQKAGIDPEALKAAMGDKSVDDALGRNFRLAEALNINGTPAFVVGSQLVPGAVDYGTLKKLVEEARGG